MSRGNRRWFALGFLVGVMVTLLASAAAMEFVADGHAREVAMERKRADLLAKELAQSRASSQRSWRIHQEDDQLRDAEDLRRQMRHELHDPAQRIRHTNE